MYAAVTPTAGGVLLTGDLNGNFSRAQRRDGKELYRFNTGGPLAGGIVTYQHKGNSKSGRERQQRRFRFRLPAAPRS